MQMIAKTVQPTECHDYMVRSSIVIVDDIEEKSEGRGLFARLLGGIFPSNERSPHQSRSRDTEE